MTGRLIGVVGPSGVGKDSLMAGLGAAFTEFSLVRRVITRDASLGGEYYDAVGEEAFLRMKDEGAFCVSWEAHGLHYGIPDEVRIRVSKGEQMLVNLSRNVLALVAERFPGFEVLNVTASPETLQKRLAGRGRESREEIARRLSRTVKPFPAHLKVHTIHNDGLLQDAVTTALELLHPVRA
ncbi:MAG: phosphonate metabolism protein/1,5-bisphosphokinase (PRPP-forming) PhnN [Pseudomonadota bacterium]